MNVRNDPSNLWPAQGITLAFTFELYKIFMVPPYTVCFVILKFV